MKTKLEQVWGALEGRPGQSLQPEEQGTWAGRPRLRDLGCCTLEKRRENVVEGVWGSRKEGGNDLLLLREKKKHSWTAWGGWKGHGLWSHALAQPFSLHLRPPL